jgi:hypothetical protein
MSMKNSSEKKWNLTRDFPVCSAVPQPLTPKSTVVAVHFVLCNESSGQLPLGWFMILN